MTKLKQIVTKISYRNKIIISAFLLAFVVAGIGGVIYGLTRNGDDDDQPVVTKQTDEAMQSDPDPVPTVAKDEFFELEGDDVIEITAVSEIDDYEGRLSEGFLEYLQIVEDLDAENNGQCRRRVSISKGVVGISYHADSATIDCEFNTGVLSVFGVNDNGEWGSAGGQSQPACVDLVKLRIPTEIWDLCYEFENEGQLIRNPTGYYSRDNAPEYFEITDSEQRYDILSVEDLDNHPGLLTEDFRTYLVSEFDLPAETPSGECLRIVRIERGIESVNYFGAVGSTCGGGGFAAFGRSESDGWMFTGGQAVPECGEYVRAVIYSEILDDCFTESNVDFATNPNGYYYGLDYFEFDSGKEIKATSASELRQHADLLPEGFRDYLIREYDLSMESDPQGCRPQVVIGKGIQGSGYVGATQTVDCEEGPGPGQALYLVKDSAGQWDNLFKQDFIFCEELIEKVVYAEILATCWESADADGPVDNRNGYFKRENNPDAVNA